MSGSQSSDPSSAPVLLSVCIPAYNRPHLLERALRSVVSAVDDAFDSVEVLVSDDSADETSEAVHTEVLGSWPGMSRYTHNRPRLGLVENFNHCIRLARGRYVLILHDDDYLLPGAGRALLHAIRTSGDRDRVLLFGVKVVDRSGAILRRQRFDAERYLAPRAAVSRALSESSFVRFPAIVVRRDAFDAVGPFNPDLGNPADLDMWIRLFARFGARCMPQTTCAYSVHEGAVTEGMFDAPTIRTIMLIFDRVASEGPLAARVVRGYQTRWFHQFILGGAIRRLRQGDKAEAARILQLFDLPAVRTLGWSGRWLLVRIGVSVLACLPAPAGARIARALGRVSALKR